MLEDYALGTVPNGPHLLDVLLSPAPVGREDGLVLAVGGVAFDREARPPAVAAKEAERLRAAEGRQKKLFWPALPGTVTENARVAELAGKRKVRKLEGDDAGTARLLLELPQARWAHLAPHGFFVDKEVRSAFRVDEKDYERSRRGEKIGVGARNPLVLSGLVLAGANLPRKDADHDGGILTAEAIAGLDLGRMDLAVLSACETGLGEVAGGEVVLGLQRAFHLAGARTVVASLWKVDDEETRKVMTAFYENLWHKGHGPLQALREAQLQYLAKASHDGKHPRYWAAWVLSGDAGRFPDPPTPRPPSKQPEAAAEGAEPEDSMLGLPAAAVGAFLAVVFIAVVWRHKRRSGRAA